MRPRTHEDLIEMYNLDREKLLPLYDCIISFLNEKGITVHDNVKLDPFVEAEIFKNDVSEIDIYQTNRTINGKEAHHESCLSDGMDIWLHEDIEEIGGITGRLYDILHVGCGHIWQWGANNSSNLEFFGERAWRVGSTYYAKTQYKKKLFEVRKYEKEAGMLALANLKLLLKKYEFDTEFSLNFIRLFNDYLTTDLEYIMLFYKNHKVVNIFDNWIFNAPPFGEKNVNFELYLNPRTNKCISLLRNLTQSSEQNIYGK